MKFMKLGSKPDAFRSEGRCIRFDLFRHRPSSSSSKSFLAVDLVIFCVFSFSFAVCTSAEQNTLLALT